MAVPKAYSVSQINRYIRRILEKDVIAANVWIRGEISNYKRNTSGHIYFTLKDKASAIACVMFQASAASLRFALEDGMSVTALGYISLYEKTGQYQFYVEYMEPAGLGALAAAFSQLKERLAAEGLFDVQRKKALPRYPQRIALITSPTGAAVQDMLRIIKRRYPCVKLTVLPVQVQGEKAAEEITAAIHMANQQAKSDIILLGRGGGSAEDLHPFNEEIVARAVSASSIPIISGVGHETDVTIADFAADVRASTPSAAAELAVPDSRELERMLEDLYERIKAALFRRFTADKGRLVSLAAFLLQQHPKRRIQAHMLYLEPLLARLLSAERKVLLQKEKQFSYLVAQMEAVSPMAVLHRGYCLCYTADRMQIKTVQEAPAGGRITIQFTDGAISALVEGTKKVGEKKTKL